MENQQNVNQPIIKPSLSKASILIKNAWQIYRSRFWTLVWLTLIPALAATIIFFVFGLITISSTFFATFYVPIIPIVVIIILILVIILSLWCWLASIYAIRDRNEAIGVRESLRRAWGKQLLSFWWLGILEFFTLLGGFVLGVVPAIIFAVWFSLSSFTFVVEGQRGLSALLRSKEYVQGKWWGVFWRLVIIFIFWLALSLIILVVNFVASENIADTVSVAVSVLLWPFILAYLFVLYDALRKIQPQLAGQPVTAKKRFFIFASVLGIASVIVAMLVLMGLSSLRYY